jgi:hypothetical protein
MLNFVVAGRFRRLVVAVARLRLAPVVVVTAGCALITPSWAGTLTFQDALNLAEQRSPTLRARQAGVEGAYEGLSAAGQLPDPKLAVGVENYPVTGADRFSWNRESMTMRRIGVMQEVPNAAKRAAQRGSAEARTERERAMLEAERLSVRREAAVAWLAQHYAERKLQVFSTLERENQVLQSTLAARIAGGRAAPADALMARQEALGLAERRDELQAGLDRCIHAEPSRRVRSAPPARGAARRTPAFGSDVGHGQGGGGRSTSLPPWRLGLGGGLREPKPSVRRHGVVSADL